MSSAPFSDLASTLKAFADSLGEIVGRYQRGFAPGSEASKDCATEAFAGEWGRIPSQSAINLALLGAVSCVDHLQAASYLIESRGVVTSPLTVVRGATEAAARVCYLLDPSIDTRERIRRSANIRLQGFDDSIKALGPFKADAGAAARITHFQNRISAFARTAQQFGYDFHPAKGTNPPRLGRPLPSITTLIGDCVSDEPELGQTYYRRLSAVAHSRPHGLWDLMKRAASSDSTDTPELTKMGMNMAPDECALFMVAGPMSAITAAGYGEKYLGWDTSSLERPTSNLANVWGRIGRAPYPGPNLSGPRPAAFKQTGS